MVKLLLLALFITTSRGAPIFESKLLALPSENFPSLIVPKISGLYETPGNAFIPQPVPKRPVLEVPHGLEQIDLRNSPSEEREVKVEDIKQKSAFPSVVPSESVKGNVVAKDKIFAGPVPSGLYETPSDSSNTVPSGLYETPFDSSNTVPSGLYETPSDSSNTVPSGLYETPSDSSNDVPTGLYNVPSDNKIIQEQDKQQIVFKTLQDESTDVKLRSDDSTDSKIVLEKSEVVKTTPKKNSDSRTLVEEQNKVKADDSKNSFLLQNIENNVNNFEDVVFSPREPESPSGLYETPSGSVVNPLIVRPHEPELDTNQQRVIQVIENPDRAPTPSPKSAMMGMPYDFDWGVSDDETGNSFSHVESSDGTTTRGEYRVLLPDGRTQVVTFFDNGMGFNAEVTYI